MGDDSSLSTALVPYKVNSPFCDQLQQPERLLCLRGREQPVVLSQHWAADGKGGTNLGFGASIYSCSIVLADFIGIHAHLFSSKRVLELGCGLGLSTMAALISGASYVCATDGDSMVVDYARANLERNGFVAGLHPSVLRWGDADALGLLQRSRGPFDVVIAADIVAAPYAAYFDDLLRTLDAVCKTCPFYLVHQSRSSEEAVFFDAMAAANFERAELPMAAISPDFIDELRPIRIYRFDRKMP